MVVVFYFLLKIGIKKNEIEIIALNYLLITKIICKTAQNKKQKAQNFDPVQPNSSIVWIELQVRF